MAPKLWSRLFSNKSQNESKLSPNNTSINDSFDSTINDLLINNQIEENVFKKVSEITSETLINSSTENHHQNQLNTNSSFHQQTNRSIDQKFDRNSVKNTSTLSASSSTTTISSTSTKNSNNLLNSVVNNDSNQWPKVGILLFNSFGQCGYQHLPTAINKKLSSLMSSTKSLNKNNNHCNNNDRFETIICEMIFGSVALNFCAKNSSKMHKLSDDLLMTSFIFQIDFSNGEHKLFIVFF